MTVSTLQLAALAELALCWLAWALAFIGPFLKAIRQKKAVIDRKSKVGILAVMVAFMCAFTFVNNSQLVRPTAALVVSMVLGPVSVVFTWWATLHLGKQWRYVAALTQGHELITTGPYRLIRHPIYASIFGMLLATIGAWTWWPLAIPAVVFFILGTEIRVRAEDGLLAAHFGDKFTAWRNKTRAYIPFVR